MGMYFGIAIHTLVVIMLTTSVQCSSFPYMEFFGLSGQPNIRMSTMMNLFYLCSSEQKMEQNAMHCDCSKNCMKFYTCCADALWDATKNESISEYTHRFLAEAEKFKPLECLPILTGLPNDRDYTIDSILMRSECSTNSDTTEQGRHIRKQCTSTKSRQAFRPVLGNDGYIYKNKYCAICNDNNEFRQLNISVSSCRVDKNAISTKFIDQNKYCAFKLELTDAENEASLRKCGVTPTSVCSQTKETCRLCSSYITQFSDTNKNCQRNFHCLLGNEKGAQDKENLENFSPCNGFYQFASLQHDMSLFGMTDISYSKLVSFDDLADKQCSPGRYYDEVTDNCIQDVICGPGYFLSESSLSCVRDKTNINKQFAPDNAISDPIEKCFANVVYIKLSKNQFKAETYKNATKTLQAQYPNLKILFQNSSEIIYQIQKNSSVQNYLNQFSYRYITIKSTTRNHFFTEMYGASFSHSFKNGKLCASPTVYRNATFVKSDNCSISFKNKTLEINDYIINIYENNTLRHVELITCQKYHLQSNCLKNSIKTYAMKENEIVEINGKRYYPDQYVPLQSGIGLCISGEPTTAEVKGWERVLNKVDSYLTIVGCACSILCYLWVILTYSIIPALKTIPGKNIVCLCYMLLCCDVIMLCSMMDSLNYKACAAMGILLHYCSLSAQFWAGILAFDIWSTFRGRSIIRDINNEKRFKLYLCVGFLFPVLLLSLFAILEFTNKVDFGYGLNGICWITRFYPRLVTYIIPMSLIILLNIAALSYTVFCIYKHARKSQKLLKKSGGENISLARMSLKLIVLLGVIEIFGLVQTSSDTDGGRVIDNIFRFLYTIVRAFRGVFVWLLYIVTDRVFKVYRDIKSQGSLHTRSSTVSSQNSQRYNSQSRKSVSQSLIQTSNT